MYADEEVEIDILCDGRRVSTFIPALEMYRIK
jgi:hypothetical protein